MFSFVVNQNVLLDFTSIKQNTTTAKITKKSAQH